MSEPSQMTVKILNKMVFGVFLVDLYVGNNTLKITTSESHQNRCHSNRSTFFMKIWFLPRICSSFDIF